jgi:hypothetical protein
LSWRTGGPRANTKSPLLRKIKERRPAFRSTVFYLYSNITSLNTTSISKTNRLTFSRDAPYNLGSTPSQTTPIISRCSGHSNAKSKSLLLRQPFARRYLCLSQKPSHSELITLSSSTSPRSQHGHRTASSKRSYPSRPPNNSNSFPMSLSKCSWQWELSNQPSSRIHPKNLPGVELCLIFSLGHIISNSRLPRRLAIPCSHR